MILLSLYCGAFLNAQCQLATMANQITAIHDANPIAFAAILPEDSYRGLLSNVKMLLEHDDITTTPRPSDPDYIRPVDGTNFQAPMSTVEVSSTPLFLDTPSPYSVFDAPKY
jgi:hypothetical protein